MSMTFSKRASVAWRAFSVWALGLVASVNEWYPFVDTLARLHLGVDASKTVYTTVIAVCGIIAWMIPQPKVSGNVKSTR